MATQHDPTTRAHIEMMKSNHLQAMVLASSYSEYGMVVLFRDAPGAPYALEFVPLSELAPVRLEAYGLTENTATVIARRAREEMVRNFPMLVSERLSETPMDFAYTYLGAPLETVTPPEGVMVEVPVLGTIQA